MFGSIWRKFMRFEQPRRDSEVVADGLDDMIFFERRLTEVVTGSQPKAVRWMMVLLATFVATIVSAYFWVLDPTIRYISFTESLTKHPVFATGFVFLILLFTVFGVQKRVIAPKIIAARCRNVLVDFYLSCDEQGRLIVRPTHGLGGFTAPNYNPPQPPLTSDLNMSDAESTKLENMKRQSPTAAFERIGDKSKGSDELENLSL
ncbi:unnamed protein product [Bursaphelenchus okinawaensis]|uniref:Transmembrane protein 188 n=1 Tax=Bursaphelenchus okinawaensis TaxID=465554 RepID=A0A811JRC5_9BILA|nr:unnamed protein product [Bursaphelenchus okinawaensis]CAG9079710.1 unnamed protein product [Bursaphelenchus okinawaensis]